MELIHNNDGKPDVTFGDGDGVQKQVLKFQFLINDVVDDFQLGNI